MSIGSFPIPPADPGSALDSDSDPEPGSGDADCVPVSSCCFKAGHSGTSPAEAVGGDYQQSGQCTPGQTSTPQQSPVLLGVTSGDGPQDPVEEIPEDAPNGAQFSGEKPFGERTLVHRVAKKEFSSQPVSSQPVSSQPVSSWGVSLQSPSDTLERESKVKGQAGFQVTTGRSHTGNRTEELSVDHHLARRQARSLTGDGTLGPSQGHGSERSLEPNTEKASEGSAQPRDDGRAEGVADSWAIRASSPAQPAAKAGCSVCVPNPEGLHLRAASQFVQRATQFQADFLVRFGGRQVNGKSIMDLLTLGAGQGAELQLEAEGLDAADAVQSLRNLVAAGFRNVH